MATAMLFFDDKFFLCNVRQNKKRLSIHGGDKIFTASDRSEELGTCLEVISVGDRSASELHAVLNSNVVYKCFGVEAANMTFDPKSINKLKQTQIDDVLLNIKMSYGPPGLDIADFGVTILSLEQVGSEWFFTVAFVKNSEIHAVQEVAEKLGLNLFSIEPDLAVFSRCIGFNVPYILRCADKTILTTNSGSIVFTGTRYPYEFAKKMLVQQAEKLFGSPVGSVVELDDDNIGPAIGLDIDTDDDLARKNLLKCLALGSCFPEKFKSESSKKKKVSMVANLESAEMETELEDERDIDFDFMVEGKVKKHNGFTKLWQFFTGL